MPNLGPVLDPNTFDDDFFTNSSLVNPVLAIDNEYRRDKRRTFNVGGNASYNFTKNLTFRSTARLRHHQRRPEHLQRAVLAHLRQAAGSYQNLPLPPSPRHHADHAQQLERADYNFKKGKHRWTRCWARKPTSSATPSSTCKPTSCRWTSPPSGPWPTSTRACCPPATPAQPVLPSTDIPQTTRLLSGFGRLNYSYDDKYLFTATFRADGSSKFEPGNRVGYFPGASVAWRISQENFLRPSPHGIGPEAAPELRPGRQQPHRRLPVQPALLRPATPPVRRSTTPLCWARRPPACPTPT